MKTTDPPPAPAPATQRDPRQGRVKRLAHVAIAQRADDALWPWYQAMGESLDRLGLPRKVHPKTPMLRDLSRAMSKLHMLRPIAQLSPRAYLIPIMQPAESRFFPVCYYAEVIPFCFDIWPPRWPEWESMFRRHRTRIAFFTARQAAAEFAQRIPEMECLWVPEATDPGRQHSEKSLVERTIDVMELGRKYDAYHDLIAPRLAVQGRSHLFEKVKGEVIYADYADAAYGLGDSKISLVFPSSLTHPARSGDVETVTLRYYEAMASRSLLVGRCPAELRDDYGYNPVVEADIEHAADQIEEILSDIGRYQDLVDRNYRKTLERGTFDARFATIIDELAGRGYHV